MAPAPKNQEIKQQVKGLKQEKKVLEKEEKQQRQVAKECQVKGDAIYGAIFNLDRKNPHVKDDFEHLPPEQLVADIWAKEQLNSHSRGK